VDPSRGDMHQMRNKHWKNNNKILFDLGSFYGKLESKKKNTKQNYVFSYVSHFDEIVDKTDQESKLPTSFMPQAKLPGA